MLVNTDGNHSWESKIKNEVWTESSEEEVQLPLIEDLYFSVAQQSIKLCNQ